MTNPKIGILLSLLIAIFGIAFLLTLSNIDTQFDAMPTLARLDSSAEKSEQTQIMVGNLSNLPIGEEMIIQFTDNSTSSEIETVLSNLGAELAQDIPDIHTVVAIKTQPITPQQISDLPDNVIIEPNYKVQSLLNYPTNDPMISDQWSFTRMDVATLWDSVEDNETVVAVIDSGVCYDHPDLQGRFLDGGYDYIDNDTTPTDEMGHGCAVSGIITANANNGIGIAGIAPNTKILPLRVLDANGVGTYADVISAIYKAVSSDADIINLSLGGQNHSQLLEQAVNYAVSKGVAVVAGAGNTGTEGVFYPAKYPNVIAVGSYDESGNQSIFSTYGNEVDTLAPGENILTTTINGDYAYFSGTSMAVPYVTGMLALSNVSGQPIDLADIMRTTAPPDNEQVEALATGVPSPTASPTVMPTFTKTPLPILPTNTPVNTATPQPFTCSDIKLTNLSFSANRIYFRLTNIAFTTYLESVELHVPAISGFPNIFLASLALDGDALWSYDTAPTFPVYIDENVPSGGGLDLWSTVDLSFPQNVSKNLQAQLLYGPANLATYLTLDDLAGTELAFHNPSNPQSPCIINVPDDLEADPTATCGTTGIELISFDEDSISYQVEDLASADEYLTDMDHGFYSDFTPVSSTIALNNITYGGTTIWQADGPDADNINDGTWLSSPGLDDGILTIHYNSSIDFTDYFAVYEFLTRFYVHNSNSNTDCNFFSGYALPSPDSPTNLTGTINGSEVNLTWTDSATIETAFIVERQAVGGMWEEVATLPADTTEFTDSIVCDAFNRWQVRSYDANTDSYSPPSLPVIELVPCGASEPSNLTALATISGTQLNWDVSQEGRYSYVQIFRQILGIDNHFIQIDWLDEEATSYLDTMEYSCDWSVNYQVVLLYQNIQTGQITYSNPAQVQHNPIACPSTDLALTIETNISNVTAYDLVNIEMTLINQGEETAHNIVVENDSLDAFYVQSISGGNGIYDTNARTWTLPSLAGNSTAQITLNVLAYVESVGTSLIYSAEIIDTDAIDPDSTPNNGVITEDDYDSITLSTSCPTSDIFNVEDGNVANLIGAIASANAENCFPGEDTINLAPDSVYNVTQVFTEYLGPNAFPSLKTPTILEGNGATLRNDFGGSMRALVVANGAVVTIKDIRITEFEQGDEIEWARGAGIINFGKLTIYDSRFDHISGVTGAAIYTAGSGSTRVDVYNSLFDNNESTLNHIVFVSGAGPRVVVYNSTFTGNYSTAVVSDNGASANLYNSTIVTNADDSAIRTERSGKIWLQGNIFVGGSTNPVCGMISNKIYSLGYNMVDNDNFPCSLSHNTDLSSGQIYLAPLADNGGKTWTHAVLQNSDNIDSIPVADCLTTTDQRGISRPQNNACDAGAFEYVYPIQAPSNVQAIPDFDNQLVTVSWTDNSNNEAGFRVFRKGSTSSDWESIADVASNITQFLDTDVLSCEQSYDYKVIAFDDSDKLSPPSNIASSINYSCVPLVPPDVFLTAVSSTILPDTVIDLTWLDTNVNVTGWHIQHRVDSGTWADIATVDNDPILRHSVLCESTNDFRVRAYRQSDNAVSDWSDIVSFISGDCPEPPAFMSITATNPGEIEITLEPYEPSDALIYIEYRLAGSSDLWQTEYSVRADQLSPVTINNLRCNTNYEFHLQAVVDTSLPNHYSQWSSISTGSTVDCLSLNVPVLSLTPVSPTLLAGTEVYLHWTDTNGENTNWYLERREENGSWQEIDNITGVQSYTDLLFCETNYEYRILAFQSDPTLVNWLGQSGWSDVVLYTSGNCPDAPIILSITATKSTQVQITWQADPELNRYIQIERRAGDSIDDNDWVRIATQNMSEGNYVNDILACQSYQYRFRQRWNYSPYTYYSDYTSSYVASGLECITAPTDLTAVSTTQTSFILSWQTAISGNDYEISIERYNSDSSNWDEMGRIPSNQTQFIETVTCGNVADLRIRIYRLSSDEYSPYSDEITVNNEGCTPDIPQSGPTYYVNTTDDRNEPCGLTYCTLRGAVLASNQNVGHNTIVLPAGTYIMRLGGNSEGQARRGDLNLRDDLTILGDSAANTIIDANGIDRVFELILNSSLTLDNISLLNSKDFTGSDVRSKGGGLIYAKDFNQLIISNSVFQDALSEIGGAIYALRGNQLQIDNTQFLHNNSRREGGAIFVWSTPTIIDSSLFDGNYVRDMGSSYGGAIYSSAEEGGSHQEFKIYRSTFFNNHTNGNGGAIAATNVVEIKDVIAEFNDANNGGAIYIHNISNNLAVLDNLTIAHNEALNRGGGLDIGGNINVSNTSVNLNTSGRIAGGVSAIDSVNFYHVFITHNNVTDVDYGTGSAGGIKVYSSSSSPTIVNSIIAHNIADISNENDCVAANINIYNSIVQNSAGCNSVDAIYVDSAIGVDPLLTAIQTTSEGKYYYELMAGSPAINGADDSYCSSTDYLGQSRPIGVHCDMGTVESAFTLNPPTNLTGSVSYSDVTITWDDNSKFDQSVVVERSLDGTNWNTIATLASNADSYVDVGLNCPESYYYRVSSHAGSYQEYSNTWVAILTEPCQALRFLTTVSATFNTESTAQISWTDDNYDEDGYRVLKWVSGTWSEIASLSPNQTSYEDSSISCQSDSTYEYRIQAYRDVDNTNATSNTADIWTGICPFNAPTSLATSIITDEQIDMIWLDNSILESAYALSRSVDNVNWTVVANLPADTMSYSDTALECEQLYYYRLQGYQSLFDRYTDIATLSATTAKCEVAIPNSVTTTLASNKASLTWKPIPQKQTSQINVERAEQQADVLVSLSGEQALNWQMKASLPDGINIFTDDDLRCGMIYWYRIQGYNDRYNEYTPYSEPIEISTSDCPVPVTNTVGLYQNGRWIFRDGLDNSAPTLTFRFGPQEAGWIPLTGDWDGDGVDGIGIYKDGIFALRDVSERGVSDYVYRFGDRESGSQPLVGDWDGDGQDTVGLYKDGLFVLTNSHEAQTIDYQFVFGRRESGWIAITGDWTAAGRDFVGLYKDSVFQLHDSFKTQVSGQSFRFGPDTDDWTPIAGDWDADGNITIGLYKDKSWRLRNSNNRGQVDVGFSFGNFSGIAYPIASYRGGEEALEALAFVSMIPLPDVDMPEDELQSVTEEPTETILVTVSPTTVDTRPSLTAPVSSTDSLIEPAISATPTAEILESPTATSEITVEVLDTRVPTMTLTITPLPSETAEPTIVPTVTGIPSATLAPTNTPTATQVIPEATQEPTTE